MDIQDLTFVTAAAAGIGSYAAAVSANKKREKSSVASTSSSVAGQSSVETSTIQVTKKKTRGPAVAESLARGRGGGKGTVGDTRHE